MPELEEVLGDNSLFSGRFALTHDTRDSPFAPTEGHMFEVSFEQVFGTYSYPRVETDFRRYFLLRERVDRSGRHVLGTSLSASFQAVTRLCLKTSLPVVIRRFEALVPRCIAEEW
ncbi:MAG: BamA/TamA family outer membrane protein [Pirellulaceae bacterium]